MFNGSSSKTIPSKQFLTFLAFFNNHHSTGTSWADDKDMCMTKYCEKIPHDVMKCFAHSFGSFHDPRIEFHDVKSSDGMP